MGIVHGCDPYVFLAHEDIAGDPNWTIESLYQIFKREEQKRAAGLPRILYLQLDNCFRENKNTYLFAWLSWLVERSVFDHVFVSFLPTGHTHFDCDQFASRIAVALKFLNVKTVEEYIDAIRQYWGTPVCVQWVDEVMDIKELSTLARIQTSLSGRPSFGNSEALERKPSNPTARISWTKRARCGVGGKT